MNFRDLITLYFFQEQHTYTLQEIAIKGLQEGLDTPSLCILAGLEKNETPSVIDYYFKQTLIELNIFLPIDKKGALKYAEIIIDNIINDKIGIIEGTKEIIDNVLWKFEFTLEDKFYRFDGIAFEKAYSLYWQYDDLVDCDYDWNKELSNEVLNEIKTELIIWKTKLNDMVTTLRL